MNATEALADDRAYHRLVDHVRAAMIAGEWNKVHAVAAELPDAVDDALRGLTPTQLQNLVTVEGETNGR